MMPAPAAHAAALLARRGGRRELQSRVLALIAAAVGAALLLMLAAVWFAAGSRADRTSWLNPRADAGGNVIAVRTVTAVDGRPVIVMDLARVDPDRSAPPPPGLPSFPAPGQVYLSPALSALVSGLPSAELGDRFPAGNRRSIGSDGLGSPDELLAVVGHRATDRLVSKGADIGAGYSERVVTSGFGDGHPDVLTSGDAAAVVVAVGLVGVPIVVLSAAAGRLGAARREQRLAALRLAGGTPRQILAMAAYESGAVGLVGGLGGVAAYAAALPLLARFRLGIGGWYVDELWVGLPVCLAVVVLVAILNVLSALTILSRVVRDPLGVARRSRPSRVRMIRVVVALALVGYVVLDASGGLTPAQVAALATLVYGAFWLAGPWVVARVGTIVTKCARRPAMLLAGRRLLDDPKSTWRSVCGLVLAGLIAGFASLVQLDLGGAGQQGQVAVSLQGSGQSSAVAAARARIVLDTAGLADARVRPATDRDTLPAGQRALLVTVPGGASRVDTAVTALTRLDTAARPWTAASVDVSDRTAIDEYSTIAFASLLLGFLVATVSTALTSAADVLDRRQTYRLVRRAGAPLRVISGARSLEVAIPLLVLAGGSTATGVYAAIRVNSSFGASAMDVERLLRLIVCVAVGGVAILGALRSTRPLLDRVTREGGMQQQ